MNKLFIMAILAIVGLSLGQTYYNEVGPETDRTGVAMVLTNEVIAEFVVDVAIDSGEIAYSRVYDIRNLPLVVSSTNSSVLVATRNDSSQLGADTSTAYSGTISTVNTVTTTLTQNLDAGDVMTSCYDVDGTAGDSVNIEVVLQKSVYGANGFDPFDTYSDAWATLDSNDVSGASASGALVEGASSITLTDESTRFLRWKITNLSGDADDDDARCRVFWQRKQRLN